MGESTKKHGKVREKVRKTQTHVTNKRKYEKTHKVREKVRKKHGKL